MENTTCKVSSELSSFALRLFSQLPNDKNLIFSPTSIYMALSMAALGSSGETLEEFKKVLGFEDSETFARDVHAVTQKLLSNSEGIQTRIANKIYSGLPNLKAGYQSMMDQKFASGLEKVNFQQNFDQIRLNINKWVEEVTNNKIKDLLQSGTLTPATVMVLVNAIYFKGNWNEQFPKHRTHKAQFMVSKNKEVEAELMNNEKKYPYFENQTCQYVQIPYKGKEYVMEVILPQENLTLDEFEGKFTLETLSELRQNVHEVKINLTLPKFKIEDSSANSIKLILTKLGLTQCFDRRANFTMMDDNERILIDDVIHKAMIEVNEEGAEAAAATAIMMRCFMLQHNPQVICNRPFIYTISHKPSGSILFMGRLTNPME